LPRSVLYLDKNDPGLPFAIGICSLSHHCEYRQRGPRRCFCGEPRPRSLDRAAARRNIENIPARERDRPVGAVVTIGPAALQFMLRSRADLWPEMAVVFASVDPETVAREQLPDGVTGLVRRRSIVEAHGGRLSAAPAHPHGTVFQIFLPVGIAGAA
jgi:hypothetical protein